MRARLPALLIAGCLLAGCSDPAGAAREERRKSAGNRARAQPSPSAMAPRQSPPTRPRRPPSPWWQPPAKTVTSGGLRVRTGPPAGDRISLVVTDLRSRKARKITATAEPRSATVGRFRLTRIRVTRSPVDGHQGVGFVYARTGRPGSPHRR